MKIVLMCPDKKFHFFKGEGVTTHGLSNIMFSHDSLCFGQA